MSLRPIFVAAAVVLLLTSCSSEETAKVAARVPATIPSSSSVEHDSTRATASTAATTTTTTTTTAPSTSTTATTSTTTTVASTVPEPSVPVTAALDTSVTTAMAAAEAPVRYSEQELLEFEYAPDEQSDRVQQLQVILGVVADGWYGPVTQQAHTRRLNGEPALPACGGCVTVDIPAAGVSSSARPGGQSVIDGHRGIAVYSPLTNTSWGSPGILWLAGHRTSHGGIFEGVPNLPAGATITVTTGNGGVHRYSVIGMKVVTQDGYRGELNLNNQSTERLFIQTSHPDPYLRYIVEAAPIG